MAVVVVDLLACAIVLWVFQLVRGDRLYVGFGVIFVTVIAAGAVLLTFPSLLGPLDVFSVVAGRSQALVGLALVFVLVMLIFILSQTTILSNRIARLTQEIAIREAAAASTARTEPVDRPSER
jgi:Uncharacterized conserved protein (DUF2304)